MGPLEGDVIQIPIVRWDPMSKSARADWTGAVVVDVCGKCFTSRSYVDGSPLLQQHHVDDSGRPGVGGHPWRYFDATE